MRRTTVKLPDELDARMRYEAARRGITIAALTREALEEHLGVTSRRRFLATGSGHSGRHDISERMEEMLDEMMREELDR
jgi:hypothetical protein